MKYPQNEYGAEYRVTVHTADGRTVTGITDSHVDVMSFISQVDTAKPGPAFVSVPGTSTRLRPAQVLSFAIETTLKPVKKGR